MPRPRNNVPTYRLHKQSGQAIVTINHNGIRRDVLLGKYGTLVSRTEYQRVLAELNTAGPTRPTSFTSRSGLTINELLLPFMAWATSHYRAPDGKPTSEVRELTLSLAPVKRLYGHTPAAEFGPRALAVVRQKMIDAKLCRNLVNRRIDRVRRVFKWAAAEELVPVTTFQALQTLPGLRKGRTEARESVPVKPVDPAHVSATLPFLNRHIRAMVELQRYTGMRPGEVCKLTLAEVDRSEELWLYRPRKHKTEHHGIERVIPFGPRARAIIIGFLIGESPPPNGFEGIDLSEHTSRLVAADAYQEADRNRDERLLRDLERPVVFIDGCVVDPSAALFSPYEAREERFRLMRKNRKSKVQPSHWNRRSLMPQRTPREWFIPERYAHAVAKAAQRAGVPHWHPNQLRHSYATEVRRAFGLEAAQVVLGHSHADVTQVYAERDLKLARKVANDLG